MKLYYWCHIVSTIQEKDFGDAHIGIKSMVANFSCGLADPICFFKPTKCNAGEDELNMHMVQIEKLKEKLATVMNQLSLSLCERDWRLEKKTCEIRVRLSCIPWAKFAIENASWKTTNEAWKRIMTTIYLVRITRITLFKKSWRVRIQCIIFLKNPLGKIILLIHIILQRAPLL